MAATIPEKIVESLVPGKVQFYKTGAPNFEIARRCEAKGIHYGTNLKAVNSDKKKAVRKIFVGSTDPKTAAILSGGKGTKELIAATTELKNSPNDWIIAETSYKFGVALRGRESNCDVLVVAPVRDGYVTFSDSRKLRPTNLPLGVHFLSQTVILEKPGEENSTDQIPALKLTASLDEVLKDKGREVLVDQVVGQAYSRVSGEHDNMRTIAIKAVLQNTVSSYWTLSRFYE